MKAGLPYGRTRRRIARSSIVIRRVGRRQTPSLVGEASAHTKQGLFLVDLNKIFADNAVVARACHGACAFAIVAVTTSPRSAHTHSKGRSTRSAWATRSSIARSSACASSITRVLSWSPAACSCSSSIRLLRPHSSSSSTTELVSESDPPLSLRS